MEEGSQYANGFGIQSPYYKYNCKKRKKKGGSRTGGEAGHQGQQDPESKKSFQSGKKDETG